MGTLLIVGGNDRSLHANRGDLIRELLDRGFEVQAALPADLDAPPIGPHGIPVHRLPMARTGMNPLVDLGSIRALERLLATLAPRAVLAYNPKPVIHSGLALRRFPKVRHVAMITGRGALERRPGLKGRVAGLALSGLYGASLFRPHVVLFQNEDDRAFFEARFAAVREAQVEVIAGSGVNLERFPLVRLPTGPVRFLLVAKLLVDKGVREFVEAARVVAAEAPEARFRVVGGHDPSLPHALPRSEVDGWKADGRVEFTGRVEDVRPHLAWSTVLCHPSYAEGTPRAVLEALATGRPVITTDAPGCRQTIVPGVSGLLVPPRDPVALAQAMGAMAGASAERLSEVARAAHERARTVYDVRLVNQRILEHLGAGEGRISSRA